MRTNFVVNADNGTYISPEYKNINSLKNFDNSITFEFYDNYTNGVLSNPSSGVTGTITVNGKESANSVWANIPNSMSPSTVDASDALSLQCTGPIYQLQIITENIANANFINIILDTSEWV